jgi:hypothetical protein
VAERVGFEPSKTPIGISKFLKNLRPIVPSKPLLSPLLAVDLAVGLWPSTVPPPQSRSKGRLGGL